MRDQTARAAAQIAGEGAGGNARSRAGQHHLGGCQPVEFGEQIGFFRLPLRPVFLHVTTRDCFGQGRGDADAGQYVGGRVGDQAQPVQLGQALGDECARGVAGFGHRVPQLHRKARAGEHDRPGPPDQPCAHHRNIGHAHLPVGRSGRDQTTRPRRRQPCIPPRRVPRLRRNGEGRMVKVAVLDDWQELRGRAPTGRNCRPAPRWYSSPSPVRRRGRGGQALAASISCGDARAHAVPRHPDPPIAKAPHDRAARPRAGTLDMAACTARGVLVCKTPAAGLARTPPRNSRSGCWSPRTGAFPPATRRSAPGDSRKASARRSSWADARSALSGSAGSADYGAICQGARHARAGVEPQPHARARRGGGGGARRQGIAVRPFRRHQHPHGAVAPLARHRRRGRPRAHEARRDPGQHVARPAGRRGGDARCRAGRPDRRALDCTTANRYRSNTRFVGRRTRCWRRISATAAWKSCEGFYTQCVENVLAFLDGTPKRVVNPEALRTVPAWPRPWCGYPSEQMT